MEALQQVVSIALVLGLLMAALWWLRRRGLALMPGLPVRRKSGRLEVIERLPLSPGHSLQIVRFGDREILLGTSPTGCQLLESAPWREESR